MQTRPAPPAVPPPLVPGFELGEQIGAGATSEVWAAASEADGRRVAVKVVHADLSEVDAAAREAALSALAASVHVVQVEACLPLEDGRVALVMPWLHGGSLGDLVAARGHLEPGEVVTVLAPVASALARLHGVGVVHGDVSPGNVLLDVDGRPYLADLGLGHVVGEVSPGIWGSDGYVAPEVVLGAGATTAADVYSLGALGWLCLTGTVPGAPGLRPALTDVALAAPGAARSALVGALDAAINPDAGERPDADALAWSLFEAATPTALHLVRGDDEVSAITYRLRAAAGGVDEPEVPGGAERQRPQRRRGHQGLGRRVRERHPTAFTECLGRVSHVLRRGAGSPRAARGAHRSDATSPRMTSRGAVVFLGARVFLGALALALVVVVGVFGLGPWAGIGHVDADVSSGAVKPAVGPGEQPGETRAGGPASQDPRLDVDAPSTRPRDLIVSLSGARAAAWRSGSPTLLREVDAPGSTALARDLAAVAELKRSGIRYTGLEHDVAQVSPVSATRDRAVVRARIDTSDYVESGWVMRAPRPASTGVPVLIDLVLTDAGWRVSDVRGVL